MNPFETETMAELCLRQGHHEEAVAIYRGLWERSDYPNQRNRLSERLLALGSPVAEDALLTPGIRLTQRASQILVSWRLPATVVIPAMEILLVRRAPEGITTESRFVKLESNEGTVVLDVDDVVLARAAVGHRDGGVFIPLVRA